MRKSEFAQMVKNEGRLYNLGDLRLAAGDKEIQAWMHDQYSEELFTYFFKSKTKSYWSSTNLKHILNSLRGGEWMTGKEYGAILEKKLRAACLA